MRRAFAVVRALHSGCRGGIATLLVYVGGDHHATEDSEWFDHLGTVLMDGGAATALLRFYRPPSAKAESDYCRDVSDRPGRPGRGVRAARAGLRRRGRG